MIDDPDAVRPIRERAAMRAYGRPAEKSEDISSIRQRAEQGDAEAQSELGCIYRYGSAGVPQDDAEATKWYRLAAESEESKDYIQSLRQRAERGDVDAQHSMGNAYAVGGNVVPDGAEAAKWYRLAAEQGHAKAQHSLGFMHWLGEVVPKNDAEAAKWYRRAAEQGHAEAQLALSEMCHRGEGVPRDIAEATKWRRRAVEKDETHQRAERGDAEAQYALSQNYRLGAGFPRDTMEAMKWLRLAAEQGHAEARTELDSILHRLPARIRAAGGKEGESALMECAGIYVVSRPDDGLVKVGKTGDFRGRFTQIRSDCFSAGHPNVVPVVLFPVNENRGAVEERAHAKLREYRTAGEWFNCDADTAIRAVLDSLP